MQRELANYTENAEPPRTPQEIADLANVQRFVDGRDDQADWLAETLWIWTATAVLGAAGYVALRFIGWIGG